MEEGAGLVQSMMDIDLQHTHPFIRVELCRCLSLVLAGAAEEARARLGGDAGGGVLGAAAGAAGAAVEGDGDADEQKDDAGAEGGGAEHGASGASTSAAVCADAAPTAAIVEAVRLLASPTSVSFMCFLLASEHASLHQEVCRALTAVSHIAGVAAGAAGGVAGVESLESLEYPPRGVMVPVNEVEMKLGDRLAALRAGGTSWCTSTGILASTLEDSCTVVV